MDTGRYSLAILLTALVAASIFITYITTINYYMVYTCNVSSETIIDSLKDTRDYLEYYYLSHSSGILSNISLLAYEDSRGVINESIALINKSLRLGDKSLRHYAVLLNMSISYVEGLSRNKYYSYPLIKRLEEVYGYYYILYGLGLIRRGIIGGSTGIPETLPMLGNLSSIKEELKGLLQRLYGLACTNREFMDIGYLIESGLNETTVLGNISEKPATKWNTELLLMLYGKVYFNSKILVPIVKNSIPETPVPSGACTGYLEIIARDLEGRIDRVWGSVLRRYKLLSGGGLGTGFVSGYIAPLIGYVNESDRISSSMIIHRYYALLQQYILYSALDRMLEEVKGYGREANSSLYSSIMLDHTILSELFLTQGDRQIPIYNLLLGNYSLPRILYEYFHGNRGVFDSMRCSDRYAVVYASNIFLKDYLEEAGSMLSEY